MRTPVVIAGLGLVLALPANAGINTIDAVPAATLLLPHFQVDPVDPNGVRTALTIGNASPVERMTHVVLWTDRGVPTRTFDLRLPGFGVAEIDLRALFTTGVLPQSTAGGFPACAATLPPAPLSPAQITDLRNAHTGLASALFTGNCGGTAFGDGIARGYVTIDVVNTCDATIKVPGNNGYFIDGGNGLARDDNVIWGEYSVHVPSANVAYGDTLVHIEASNTNPLTDGTPSADMPPLPDYTFYGRRINGSGADNREALPQIWMGRYTFDDVIGQTTAFVWRDPGNASAFNCASPPAGLSQREMVAFDLQENPSTTRVAKLPLASQSLPLHDPLRSSVPFSRGFVVYDLGLRVTTAPFTTRNQAHVSHLQGIKAGGAGLSAAWPVVPIQQPLTYNVLQECSDGEDNDADGFTDFPADPSCISAQFSETTACSDGIDNDGDGFIDHPADPQCAYKADLNEDAVVPCQDGIDNDSDGLIDFPNDPHCSGPFDVTEQAGICSDGIDNDGDGQTDFPNDPGCAAPSSSTENPQCNDGMENDVDGLVDFPSDLGCTAASDNSEANPACIDGIDNDGDTKVDFPADPGCVNANSTSENPQCDDGIDNDGDSLIDHPSDPGCSSRTDSTELNPPQCSDGLDNDSDGRVDFPNETGCSATGDVTETADCSDTVDNDLDGLADFTPDPGCAGALDLNELAGTTTRQCSDGIDNDNNGFTDFPADARSCASAYDDSELSNTLFKNGFE
jgi:hypothetical protein